MFANWWKMRSPTRRTSDGPEPQQSQGRAIPLALCVRQSGMTFTARPPQREHTNRRCFVIDGNRTSSPRQSASNVNAAECRQAAFPQITKRPSSPWPLKCARVGGGSGVIGVLAFADAARRRRESISRHYSDSASGKCNYVRTMSRKWRGRKSRGGASHRVRVWNRRR
jgi:hypothetical protein